MGVQVSDLSLPRRAQLAVVAHIRHTYTEYDELLRKMSWAEARRQVAPKTLEKLALWRGDKDDEPDTMEDILREVVVISDDEDDEGHETSEYTPRPGSSHARIQDDKQNRKLGFGKVERENAARVGRLPNAAVPRATIILKDDHQALIDFQRSEAQNHRRFERIQAWEQARSRLRQNGRPTVCLDSEQVPSRGVPNNGVHVERQIPHRTIEPKYSLLNGQEAVDGFRYRDNSFQGCDSVKEVRALFLTKEAGRGPG